MAVGIFENGIQVSIEMDSGSMKDFFKFFG